MALDTDLAAAAHASLAAMTTEFEAAAEAVAAMVEKHKVLVASMEADIAKEAARIPTLADLKALMARIV